jgi:hypothetical protein
MRSDLIHNTTIVLASISTLLLLLMMLVTYKVYSLIKFGDLTLLLMLVFLCLTLTGIL